MSGITSKKLTKDLRKIKKFSTIVEERLTKFDTKDTKMTESLTVDELNDFRKILQISDFILTKHQNNKEFHSVLKEFVDMINKSTSSMDLLNDEISELVLSADNSVSKIKNLQNDVSDTYSINHQALVTRNPLHSESA